ncbi:MAG: TetR/AcrR family transcriptional regulator [Chloroflexi bacterium]|nr:TetR/AcrR family transcriptional regulator [Chloroflexota bacterium]
MPRPYALGKRTEPKNETRARIVAAAARVYRDRGAAAASNLAIAKEADVAPATVRNHFPDLQDLADAVFDEILAELRPPTPAIFDGVDGIRERITRLAKELAAFYARSATAWQLYRQEPYLVEAWSGGVDRYYRDVDVLMRSSLGPLKHDKTALALVAAVIGPPAFFALQSRGISSRMAADLCVEVMVPWLEARAAAKKPRARAKPGR